MRLGRIWDDMALIVVVYAAWEGPWACADHRGTDMPDWPSPPDAWMWMGICVSWHAAQRGFQHGSLTCFSPGTIALGSGSMTTPRQPRAAARWTSTTASSTSHRTGTWARGM